MLIKAIFDFIQLLVNILGYAINGIFSLFPNSPFTFIENSMFNDLLSQINYFLPLYEMIVIIQPWLISIGIYYVYSIFGRWIKTIE